MSGCEKHCSGNRITHGTGRYHAEDCPNEGLNKALVESPLEMASEALKHVGMPTSNCEMHQFNVI